MTKEEIKTKISEHKECCKKLAEEYRQRYNEDKTDKLALNMFYHNVIAYNNFETVLSMIEDRNSMIMCFGEPPLLTEKTVEVELNHIAELEDKLANVDYQLEGRDLEIKELKTQIEKMKRCSNCKYFYCPTSYKIEKDGKVLFHNWNKEKQAYCDCGNLEGEKYQLWEIKEND